MKKSATFVGSNGFFVPLQHPICQVGEPSGPTWLFYLNANYANFAKPFGIFLRVLANFANFGQLVKMSGNN